MSGFGKFLHRTYSVTLNCCSFAIRSREPSIGDILRGWSIIHLCGSFFFDTLWLNLSDSNNLALLKNLESRLDTQ
jgi:hypothetical protein